MYFSYLEQPKTCHKCGSEFHMVNECTVFRTTKPKNRENAVDLPESPDTDSDSNFGDSRSVLSDDSEANSNNVILLPDPNNLNENVNVNSDVTSLSPGSVIDHTSTVEPSIEINNIQNNVATGATDVPEQTLYPNSTNPSSDSAQSQIPVPKARTSGISSSQPVPESYSIYNQIKRALSLSPQNTSEHHSTPKSAKLMGNVEYV